MARNGRRRGTSVWQDRRPPRAKNGACDADIAGLIARTFAISSTFRYTEQRTGFVYGAAYRFACSPGGRGRHACGLRPLRNRLALGGGLPRQPAGQIADWWTFSLCSDIGAAPGKDSSAPERPPFADTQLSQPS